MTTAIFQCMTEASRRASTWLIVIPWALAALVSGSFLLAPYLDPSPVQVLDAKLLSPTVKVGGHLEFRVRFDGNTNSCPARIAHEFSRGVLVDGIPLREKWRSPAISAPVSGSRDYLVAIPLMPQMEPGEWTFSSMSIYECNAWGGGTRRFLAKDIPFTILPQ